MAKRVAVITGASSGIGRATAQRLAEEGIRTVLVDLNSADEYVVGPTEQERVTIGVRADVGSSSAVEWAFSRAAEVFGRLDILVNCAGIGSPRSCTIVEADEREFDELLRVNVKGPFLCCRAAIPMMRAVGGGAIVNVGSELGLVGRANTAMYSTTKGALIQFTRALAADHARDGIRVNCVCPGPIDTPMLQRGFQRAQEPELARKKEEELTLIGRLGRPEEIAEVILFLASKESSFMTGAIVVADGGVTAQ